MATLVGSGDVIYPLSREFFLQGEFTWDTDTWNVFLHTDFGVDDTPDDGDDFKDDVIVGAIVEATTEANNEIGTPSSALNKGTADGLPVTLDLVTGNLCDGLIIYREVGGSQATPATDNLLVFIEAATGLPILPNGGDITITWDTGTDKIFTL